MIHSSTSRRTLRSTMAGAATAVILVAVAGGLTSASAGSTPTRTVEMSARPGRAALTLSTSSPALAECFPHARARVTVALTADAKGKDRFRIRAAGLQPRTTFTVFLLEKAAPPFGAAEYIGDITPNRDGRAHHTYRLIVEEAFAFNNQTGSRTDLNSVGFWFADPRADDKCLGPNSPVTGFDGDASAGVQMMNSGTQLLP